MRRCPPLTPVPTLCALLLAGTAAMAAPDLIVINGDIYTVDTASPRVEAFAVADGRFSAVGTTARIRALADGNTRVIDARGNTVTPGFIDGHSHVSGNSPLVAGVEPLGAEIHRVRPVGDGGTDSVECAGGGEELGDGAWH